MVLCILDSFELDRADHVERLLGQRSHLPLTIILKPRIVSFSGIVLAGRAGEHLGDVEGLRQEALDLARGRATASLSSGESSSMPRMAMMSRSSLALQRAPAGARRCSARRRRRCGSIWRLVDVERVHGGVDAQRGDVALSTTVASRWANVVAGDGSVRSSAGTYTAWIEVIEAEPVLVG